MSHEPISPPELPSRRHALGAGLFLLAGALIGLAGSPASAQSRGTSGRTGGGPGSSGPGGELVLPGTPTNCPSTMVCNATPRRLRNEPPPLPRKPQVPRPRERCGVVRPNGRLDERCRSSD